MERKNSRRSFIKKSALLTLAGAGLRLTGEAAFANPFYAADEPAFSLPDLPYPTSALEPHIDSMTMEIHNGIA